LVNVSENVLNTDMESLKFTMGT